jgi:hypothetical protein
MEELRGMCDVVILDTPAVLDRPEGAWLSARADAVVLVLDTMHARKRTIVRASAVMREFGATVIGVVLNRVPCGSARRKRVIEPARTAMQEFGATVIRVVRNQVASRSGRRSTPVETPTYRPSRDSFAGAGSSDGRADKFAQNQGVAGQATDV